MSYNLQKMKYRAKARAELKDSYIKRILRRKRGLMAKDCTQEIIEETRQSIIALRKKKELNKKLISNGKYKCSRCFIVKSLDIFYKDSSKNCGFSRCCKECASVSKARDKATKKYYKRIKENLEDIYLRKLLCAGVILKYKDIPQELIEAKRQHLKLKRITKET